MTHQGKRSAKKVSTCHGSTKGSSGRPCRRFLSGPRVEPMQLKKGMSVLDLIRNGYTKTGAFNGGRLAEACALFSRMIEENATIAMTVSGAMTPAGMGGPIISLLEAGFVDMVISTGANLYHDLHFALDLPVHQGDFRADDSELLDAGVVRIYDVFLTEQLLLDTDTFVQEAMRRAKSSGTLASDAGGVSTARIHNVLGRDVLERCKYPERSLLAHAARLGVPVYTSSPGDSSIGMNLAAMRVWGDPIDVNPDLDVLETTAVVLCAEKNGVVEIGGGSPKNFYLQTQPTLAQILGINRGGHDFFLQITTDSPQWGGLSGATPAEAVTWGKINPNDPGNSVVVYCDATVALPLLASYALSRHKPRRLKRLFDKLDTYLDELRREAQKNRRRTRRN